MCMAGKQNIHISCGRARWNTRGRETSIDMHRSIEGADGESYVQQNRETIITNLTNNFQKQSKKKRENQAANIRSKTSSFYNKQATTFKQKLFTQLVRKINRETVERTLSRDNIAVNSSLGRE